MPLDSLDTFIWPSQGIEPLNEEDAIYVAGEQPIAGYDNNVMWRITTDLQSIRTWANSHGSEHEAGGAQEIDLDDLEIGDQGSLDADGTTVALVGDGPDALRYDNSSGAITTLAEVRNGLDTRGLLRVGDDIENYDGDTIYDASINKFHYAVQADNATNADLADDSTLFDGHSVSEFLFPDEEETITEQWEFTTAIDTDILGHAATSSYAAEAGMADDSELHEGYTVADILDMAWQDFKDEFVDIEDDGTSVLQNAKTLDFADSIDVAVSGEEAVMSVTSVPHADEADEADHADEADQADNTDLHENLTVNEIVNLANADLEDDIVDVYDDDQLIIENATELDFTTSVDVSDAGGGRADVSVTSVPHADDADDTIYHEGYTVNEIVNMSNQSDGEWTHVDTLTSSDLGSITWSVPGDYDILRMLVVNEPHTTDQWNNIYMRVNGETRTRYHVLRKQYWRSDAYYSDQDDGKDLYATEQNYFPLCKTRYDITAMAEYTITVPPSISGHGSRYPTISLTNEWFTPNIGQNMIRGQIETPQTGIDELHFFVGSGRGASSFHCVIHGKNFPQP